MFSTAESTIQRPLHAFFFVVQHTAEASHARPRADPAVFQPSSQRAWALGPALHHLQALWTSRTVHTGRCLRPPARVRDRRDGGRSARAPRAPAVSTQITFRRSRRTSARKPAAIARLLLNCVFCVLLFREFADYRQCKLQIDKM